MQSVSSRIWTRVAVSISYDDNHYTTGTSFFLIIVVIFVIVLFLLFLVAGINLSLLFFM